MASGWRHCDHDTRIVRCLGPSLRHPCRSARWRPLPSLKTEQHQFKGLPLSAQAERILQKCRMIVSCWELGRDHAAVGIPVSGCRVCPTRPGCIGGTTIAETDEFDAVHTAGLLAEGSLFHDRTTLLDPQIFQDTAPHARCKGAPPDTMGRS